MPTATARGRCESRILAPAGARSRESAGPGGNAASDRPRRLLPTPSRPRPPAAFPSRPPGLILESVAPRSGKDDGVQHPPQQNTEQKLPRALTTSRSPP